ncbi:hypothetical protein M378DRAFT_159791 [Amanita muscaria Koide BX008]|uniref:Uncharacterized protein n=1 Tax=Amanita muscaria (strain Koide BX008) TaxID=946122 RepID=A0A0C2SVA9_AMAMK|nr:hypothetical protein M378DRAFT_159791 [Amanita muscaria Koide BX008]
MTISQKSSHKILIRPKSALQERQVAVEDESARCQNLISSTYMLVQLGLLGRSSIFDLMQLELECARDMYR